VCVLQRTVVSISISIAITGPVTTAHYTRLRYKPGYKLQELSLVYIAAVVLQYMADNCEQGFDYILARSHCCILYTILVLYMHDERDAYLLSILLKLNIRTD
jgi:hypothetical protein